MTSMWWSRLFASAALGSLAACAGSAHHVAPPAPMGRPEPVAVAAPARPQTQVDPPPTQAALADARHLLSRFAFGPRPGEVERVARSGVERWLDEQLAGPPESPLLEASLVPYRAAFVPPSELVDDWLGDGWEHELRSVSELRRETKPFFRDHLQRLATAEVVRDILSQRQLEAVMTDFWANHFNVYAAKGFVRLFHGDYLERAIRPHALGKFSDLLLATARHPAMLIYLDNAESRKARRGGSGRRSGLNENYARELLELHTLGVDGGYTQADVQDVARVLTGWSIVRLERGRLGYQFRRYMHDRGEKTVLGHVFPAGENEAEGVRLLQLLARHPSTARHLARRLCSRFVMDAPPESCVDAAADAYTASDGDIKRVVHAIATHPSFWAEAARGAKLKTPLELLASAARAVGARPDGSLSLAETLEEMGAPLLQERVPTGYPDTEPEWASAGGMLARMSFASQLAEGRARGLQLTWEDALPTDADPSQLVAKLAAALLGLPPESRTVRLVLEEVSKLAAVEQRRPVALALLIGSPEFQRQ